MKKENFFKGIQLPIAGRESFDTVFQGADITIERIISNAHVDKSDAWYDQQQDEWVMLVEGEARLLFEGEDEIRLTGGDFLYIPAHKRHRVTYTSSDPPCFWLAIHGNLK